MRYFYIDTENVKDYSFISNWEVGKGDIVILFASENSGTIKLNLLSSLELKGAKLVFEDVILGEKNAMDFQMVSCLAMNIASNNSYTENYIVSDDNGFNTAIKYLSRKYRNADIFIIKPSYDTTATKILNNAKNLNDLNKGMRESLDSNIFSRIYSSYKNRFTSKQNLKGFKDNLKSGLKDVHEIYLNASSEEAFYNTLRNKFGRTAGSQIYIIYKNYSKKYR